MTTLAPAEQDELRHEYSPRGSAVRLFNCRDDEVLLSGPAGPGKTRACLEKMLTMALVNGTVRTDRATGEPIRDAGGKVVQHRPFVGLIARKTHKSLTSTTLETWREHVAAEAIKGGLCVYYGGSATEPPQYRFANGAKILLTGLNDVTRVMGAEVDLVYVGEATECTPKDWEFLTSRLRNGAISFQQIIADCNPDRPTHWLKQRCDEGLCTILYAQHWENPRYFEDVGDAAAAMLNPNIQFGGPNIEEHDGRRYQLTPAGVSYIGRLDNLTGVRKQRLRHGVWCAADGLVYDNWDPAIHIAETRPKTIPWEWPRFWVVDFGYKNPFVCQWWAQDPDDQLILYREIYHTGRLVEHHARLMLKQVTRIAPRIKLTKEQLQLVKEKPADALEQNLLVWTEPEPQAIICDHDAEGRATLTEHLGRGTTAANKTVTAGIQAVEARLKVRGNGKPGLILLPDSLVERDLSLKEAGKPMATVEEFGGYVWEPAGDGKAEKESPLKLDDHGVDCVRYLVAHRDLGVRFRDRELWLEG
jgi:hypothetical protein